MQGSPGGEFSNLGGLQVTKKLELLKVAVEYSFTVDHVDLLSVTLVFLHLVKNIPYEFDHVAIPCRNNRGGTGGVRHAAHFPKDIPFIHRCLSCFIVNIRGAIVGYEDRIFLDYFSGRRKNPLPPRTWPRLSRGTTENMCCGSGLVGLG